MTEKIYELFKNSTGVETDTRKIGKGALFFCLKGENFNANEFAEEALEKGAIAVIADEEKYVTNERIILVDNVLTTLQQLANHHRRQFDIPVIGITGTNGKTTTKELVTTVLSAKFRTHATAGNFNNHIGVPLTLLSMPTDTEIAVVEMGANHPGEIGELCRIAEPDHGIITNIGKAHLEGFGSLQGVIDTKRELYDYVSKTKGKVFVDASNDLLMKLSNNIDRLTYGTAKDARYKAELISSEPFLTVKLDDNTVETNLLGIYNLTNLAAAWATGRYFGVDAGVAAKALSDYKPANKRSQFMETAFNKIYLDAYNANPTSMENALKSFAEINLPHKVAILGDMLELGDESFDEHLDLMEKIKTYGFEETIFVGPEFCKAAGNGFRCFENTGDTAAYLQNHKLSGKFILLKGSRGIGLEKLLPVL